MGNYLVEGPLNGDLISEIISDDKDDLQTGAVSLFLGKVRADVAEGKTVTAIEYSAYPDMVSLQGDKMTEEIRSLYPDVRSIVIKHSCGIVKAGEISLVIKVSASHRGQAIKACHDIIEKIKESFPVWKKEFFSDETTAWKQK